MQEYAGRPVYAVSELVELLSRELEGAFPDVWVEGEVASLKRAASGHLYFGLKDSAATLKTVMFRTYSARLAFDLENGMKVLARGRLGVYAAGGDLQLYATALEPAGLGALQMALEQARKRLAAEGLTDPARKRALPPFPARVAVVTSVEGAALRDVLSVLARRRAAFEVVVVHSPVQGADAPALLRAALERAARLPGVEVVLLTRGGGSMEDLWAFNDETLARAVAACPVPVVSAVGHEVDTVLTDLTADLRAPTPSVGAELLTRAGEELLSRVRDGERRLRHHARSRLYSLSERLSRAGADRLRTMASRRTETLAERLDRADGTLRRAPAARLERERARLASCRRALGPEGLRRWVDGLGTRATGADARLRASARGRIETARAALARRAELLDAVSPLRTLARGFAIATDSTGRLLTDAARVAPGDPIAVRLSRGALDCRVEKVHGPPTTDDG